VDVRPAKESRSSKLGTSIGLCTASPRWFHPLEQPQAGLRARHLPYGQAVGQGGVAASPGFATYMVSDDPEFEKKTAAIIGLYLKPPAHAAVFCVDEKSAIQALDRLDPVLPLFPGRAERHGLESFATALFLSMRP
jgi:hypothetical protein